MDESPTRTRRHPRIAREVPVQMTTIDPEVDPRTGRPCFRNVREYCGNLSRGGVFIRTHDPVSPGHRVLVQFHMAGAGPIEAVGRVAWSKTVLTPETDQDDCGIGVEFEAAPGRVRDAIARFLEDDDPNES